MAKLWANSALAEGTPRSREAFSGFFSVLGVRDGAVVGVPKTGTEDGGQAGLVSAPQAVPEVAR